MSAREVGGAGQPHASTFSVNGEDHTLGNSLRFVLNADPRVTFCGYSVPHPSETRVNIRVQTTGEPAKVVVKDGLRDLMLICEHVSTTYRSAVERFKTEESGRDVSTTHVSGLSTKE